MSYQSEAMQAPTTKHTTNVTPTSGIRAAQGTRQLYHCHKDCHALGACHEQVTDWGTELTISGYGGWNATLAVQKLFFSKHCKDRSTWQDLLESVGQAWPGVNGRGSATSWHAAGKRRRLQEKLHILDCPHPKQEPVGDFCTLLPVGMILHYPVLRSPGYLISEYSHIQFRGENDNEWKAGTPPVTWRRCCNTQKCANHKGWCLGHAEAGSCVPLPN